jgi:hypothetical protein
VVGSISFDADADNAQVCSYAEPGNADTRAAYKDLVLILSWKNGADVCGDDDYGAADACRPASCY